ncbi:hypothetical protein BKI52_29555 [marine bacterium AO1-C]|nr:hypothetical protein BKI52_29555 [marine bacterium AO1-C]
MKNYHLIFLVPALAIFLNACGSKKPQVKDNHSSTTNNESPTTRKVSFGQKPPGIVPIPFTTGTLSQKDRELKGMFAPDMKEFYFTPCGDAPFHPAVTAFRKEKNGWKEYNFHQYGNDDNILYSDTKYIERTDSGWSKIKSLGPMFDRDDWGIMRLSVSDKGTYVFDDYKSKDVIRMSRIKNGKREAPKLLGKEINTGKWTAHPFIAPDDSYLIWDSERADGYGDSDLYISFRQQDGSWGAAINLGDKINTTLSENGAWVTLDGKYLFFDRSEEKVRKDGSKYWVTIKHWVDFIQLKRELIQKKNANS